MARPILEGDYILSEPRYIPPVSLAEPLLNLNKTVTINGVFVLVHGSGFTPHQFEDNHTPIVIQGNLISGVTINGIPIATDLDNLKDESTCFLPLLTSVPLLPPTVNIGPLTI